MDVEDEIPPSLPLQKGGNSPLWQTERVPYVGGLDTRREHTTGVIQALAYPTPTPTLPLKGRIITMVLFLKGKEILTFLPLQGGGQEGDGGSVGVPLVSSAPIYG